jgi:predicted RNase H-like HicB family nuclease
MKLSVRAIWDAEVEVWVATSEDIPGLATEAETIEALTIKLRNMIPELMILNKLISENYSGSINFDLTTFRQELIEVGK